MAGRIGLKKLLVALLIAAVLGGAALWVVLRLSLPVLDGAVALPGLAAVVTVSRDAGGYATIQAANERDLARATGFVHAQERFFQMDLQRRAAAGELAALFGAAALDFDLERRAHRMRSRAERQVQGLDPEIGAALAAYAAGVNQGLKALGTRPFEYLLLDAEAEPWTVEDSLLVALGMYFTLQADSAEREREFGALAACLPAAAVHFLTPAGDRHDAPLFGAPFDTPKIPAAAAFDARQLPVPTGQAAEPEPPAAAGSNNWAIAGRRTASGAALVANDMHLGLNLPHLWFKVRMSIGDGPDRAAWSAAGVSLPGLPFIVAGSNGDIAWGFTNAYGDFLDLIIVETDPADDNRYLIAGGSEAFTVHEETIAVNGGATQTLKVRETRWGPVIDEDHAGRALVWRWVAHDERALAFDGLWQMAQAKDVKSAIRTANSAALPAQNLIVGDRDGSIGWTIIGPIPLRSGDYDSRFPASWAVAGRGWLGWLPAASYPRLIDPPGGILWTANARVATGETLALLGDGGYPSGERAGQIRDRLHKLHSANEREMLAIQLDDEARGLVAWRRWLLGVLDRQAVERHPKRGVFRRLIAAWSGHAAIDDAGYRLLREYRERLRRRVFGDLTAHCPGLVKSRGRWQWRAPLRALIVAEPGNWLPPGAASWPTLYLEEVDGLIADAEGAGGTLEAYRWGERNRLDMTHPLADSIPLAGRRLTMPAVALPGDHGMPRVQTPRFGASERFAVSPGQEQAGYLQMPGGNSGHPLSPYFGAGHDDWVAGRPTPFLPGPDRYRLRLVPENGGP